MIDIFVERKVKYFMQGLQIMIDIHSALSLT
jgi:hypothetical protein